jgi:hypothetical protein
MSFRGTPGYISPLFYNRFRVHSYDNDITKLMNANSFFTALYGTLEQRDRPNYVVIWRAHSKFFALDINEICKYNDYYGYYVTLYMFYKRALVELNKYSADDYKTQFNQLKNEILNKLKTADYPKLLQQGGASRRKHIVYRNNQTKSYLVHKDDQGMEYIKQRGLGKVYLKDIRGKYLLVK